jgi:hypothetical protein
MNNLAFSAAFFSVGYRRFRFSIHFAIASGESREMFVPSMRGFEDLYVSGGGKHYINVHVPK